MKPSTKFGTKKDQLPTSIFQNTSRQWKFKTQQSDARNPIVAHDNQSLKQQQKGVWHKIQYQVTLVLKVLGFGFGFGELGPLGSRRSFFALRFYRFIFFFSSCLPLSTFPHCGRSSAGKRGIEREEEGEMGCCDGNRRIRIRINCKCRGRKIERIREREIGFWGWGLSSVRSTRLLLFLSFTEAGRLKMLKSKLFQNLLKFSIFSHTARQSHTHVFFLPEEEAILFFFGYFLQLLLIFYFLFTFRKVFF